MALTPQEAQGLLTKKLIAVYKERPRATSFLRSFFRVVESTTKTVSIEVQRGTEKIAVDVERGTRGNRNSFSRSTESIFLPPYYKEYFDATELDLYDRLFGTEMIDASVFTDFVNAIADKLAMLQAKIDRAIEKMCSDVLNTGELVLKSGDKINFKRKTASKVTSAFGTGNSPYKVIEAGCSFIRTKGKYQGTVYNAIFSSDAWTAFLENADVIQRNDLKNMALDSITAPQAQTNGTLHGEISAGSYRVRLWTYPEYFEDTNGDTQPYLPAKKVIILPETPNFVLAFAGVPQLFKGVSSIQRGQYIINEYMDERETSHDWEIKSAPVPVPVAVDQIYTVQVIS